MMNVSFATLRHVVASSWQHLIRRSSPRVGAVCCNRSRLAGRRLVFHPYDNKQLEEIITARVEGLGVFEAQAITFAARKVGGTASRPVVIAARTFISVVVDTLAVY